jgi:hypothetical protein
MIHKGVCNLVSKWIASVMMTGLGVLGSRCKQRFREAKVSDIMGMLTLFFVLGVDLTAWVKVVKRDVSQPVCFSHCPLKDEIWGSV